MNYNIGREDLFFNENDLQNSVQSESNDETSIENHQRRKEQIGEKLQNIKQVIADCACKEVFQRESNIDTIIEGYSSINLLKSSVYISLPPEETANKLYV